jgi:hypothetical protein
MSSFFRIITSQTSFRLSLAAAVTTVYSNHIGTGTLCQQQQQKSSTPRYVTYCDAAPVTVDFTKTTTGSDGLDRTIDDKLPHHTTSIRHGGQMNITKQDSDDNEYYYGLFPLRQLFVPYIEYPLWDDNWDERKPVNSLDKKQYRHLRKSGVTRHIILIRHGQYDETHKVRYCASRIALCG